MKIRGIQVNGLYNTYNYDINFNDDLTFIHGINGCGKTTVLTLITYIITGQIYKLYDYPFSHIQLSYLEFGKSKKIIVNRGNDYFLKVVYNGRNYDLNKIPELGQKYYEDGHPSNQRPSSIQERYFDMYPWLSEIKSSFNFIFLPLSRTFNSTADFYEERALRARKSSVDHSLITVRQMIRGKYIKIMSQINKINEKFRNDIFKTSFHFNEASKITFSHNFNAAKDKVKKTLKDLEILNPDFEQEIDVFYEKLSTYSKSATSKKQDESDEKLQERFFTYVANYSRIQQMYELSQLADELNIEKERAMLPVNKFLLLINEFFKECNKSIRIDYNTGHIYFTVNDCSDSIGIEKLSSGEKQLLIFYAYLIFGLREDEEGVFIVDEPELSLHLSWQRIFVKSIFETNDKIQLIFATHSPEIISTYRGKVVQMIPTMLSCPTTGEGN